MLKYLILFLMPVFAFAQEAVDLGDVQNTLEDVSNQDFLQDLLSSLGGFKGATTIAIIGILVKLFLRFLNTPWAATLIGKAFKENSGSYKLTLVLALSMASGIVGLMASGLSIGAALVHSTTLTAFVVLSNQIYQKYIEKKP